MNATFRRLLTAALALLVIALLLLLRPSLVRHLVGRSGAQVHPHSKSTAGAASQTLNWNDSFGDGTPDFLRLSDPADQAAFRRWFTLIAEYQAIRPKAQIPAEITDCASLLRYSYREALKRHDDSWFLATGIEVAAPPGEIRAWHYPNTPLGAALFRVRPGSFESADATNGAFAQFADAKTLVERNAHPVSRDVREALPGDLLFYRQFGQSSPWHSMIVTEAAHRHEWFITPDRITVRPASYAACYSPSYSIILSRSGGRWLKTLTFSAFTAGIFCEELHEAP